MTIEKDLQQRSGSKCELCGGAENLSALVVEPSDESILVCGTCSEQMDDVSKMDPNHWRCLNDSMWSEVPAVQVIAWRMLTRLRAEGWPQDLLDIMYLDDKMLIWAEFTGEGEEQEDVIKHIDSNGVMLQSGDNVVLIKDLNVKGTSVVAKRGTAVRSISLDHDNEEYIEGRVNGQQIVILTKFVKKM